LFRISKGDDPIERRDTEDETAEQGLPQADSGVSVASSALRWFRKSPKPAETAVIPVAPEEEEPLPRNVGFFRPSDRDEQPAEPDEELELTLPLNEDELDDDDSDAFELHEPSPSPVPAVVESAHTEITGNFSDLTFEFDDDDDIDDFDDLGHLDALPTPKPPDKTSFSQEIDLNDFAALKAWYLRIAERPATVKGYDVPKPTQPIPMP
jgi:hypothetical protein